MQISSIAFFFFGCVCLLLLYTLCWRDYVCMCKHYYKLRKHVVGRAWGMNATCLPAPYRDLLFVEKIILCLARLLLLPTSACSAFIIEKPRWDVLAGPCCGQIQSGCVSLFQSNCWIEMTKLRNKLNRQWVQDLTPKKTYDIKSLCCSLR